LDGGLLQQPWPAATHRPETSTVPRTRHGAPRGNEASHHKKKEGSMPVKFNQYWSIAYDKSEEYAQFLIRSYIPGLNELGIHTVAGWLILVGGYSEIILEGVSNDLGIIEAAITTPRFKELNDTLLNYVNDYKTKIFAPTGRKDTYSIDIKEKTVKLNQMWNVVSKTKEDYARFVEQEFYPCMESLGISVAGEWEVLIGDGPRTLCEGRATDVSALISNLQTKEFRKAKEGIRKYIEDYQSRILSFHIQKVHGYKSASYNVVSV
jgi:hypothetical protein